MTNMALSRYKWLLALFSLLATQIGNAAGVEEDGAIWFNVHMQGDLPAEHLHWSMDTNPRWRDEGGHLDQLYLRPSVFYKVNPKTSLWLGHDNIVRHSAGKSPSHEYRLWQQFQYQFDPVSEVTFTNRTRIEQRHREGYHGLGYRLRQMVKASTPLLQEHHLALIVSDELFINLNQTDWSSERGFDQNRLFIGLNWKFNQSSSIEAGYLNQFIHTQAVNRDNHVLATTLGISF